MTGNLILDIYDDVDDGGGGNQIVEEFTLDEPSGAENGDLFNLKALLCFLAICIVCYALDAVLKSVVTSSDKIATLPPFSGRDSNANKRARDPAVKELIAMFQVAYISKCDL